MMRIKGWVTALVLAAAPSLAFAFQEEGRTGTGSEGRRAGETIRRSQDEGNTGTTGARAREQDRATGAARLPGQGQGLGQGQLQGRAGGMQQFSDQLFVAAATEAGQAEIAVSQLALQRAQSEEVRRYAQQMIEDHTQANQQLMQLRGTAGGRGGAAATPTARPGATERPAAAATGRAGASENPAAAGAGAQTETARRTQEPGQDETQTRTALRPAAGQDPRGGRGAAMMQTGLPPGKQAEYAVLASKSGEEFDRAYAKQQVAAHMCAVALFEAAAENCQDPEIRRFATETLPKLQHHLQMARQLPGAEDAGHAGAGGAAAGQQPRGEVRPPAGTGRERPVGGQGTGTDRGTGSTDSGTQPDRER